jgi:hypothetical protein
MFGNTSNYILDSFWFRIGLTAAFFAVWASASYFLLAVA